MKFKCKCMEAYIRPSLVMLRMRERSQGSFSLYMQGKDKYGEVEASLKQISSATLRVDF